MSIDKNVPPYIAHSDGNQTFSIVGVEGTLGTSDTGGTARVIPIGANPLTGAMYVQDLSGASGTTNVQIVGGTLNAGTVTASIVLNTGTITTIAAGTQNTLGTVGTVIGVGTISNIVTTSGTVTGVGVVSNVTTGSLTNVAIVGTNVGVGTVSNIGSITNIGNLPTLNLTTGTITTGSLTDVAKLYSGTINVGTFVQPSGTITTGSLTNVAIIGTNTGIGTLSNVGSVNTVTTTTTVSNLTNGTVRISVGTITTGSLTDLTNLYSGSVRMTVGTVTTGSLTNLAGLHTGTITTGSLTSLASLHTGTIRQDYRPVGSSVLSTHTLGTGGGTLFGTLLAPSGAGTSVYLAGLSIVGRSGTVDCGIANNVAGSTGAGVYARGFFQPGGGIARDFSPAINLGTNGTIAYFLITAGTVDFTVNYWVTP